MPTRSPAARSSTRSTTFVAVVVLAFAPAMVRAAGPAEDCVRLVSVRVREFDRSAVNALQQEVQANRITALMVDALGKKFGLGAAWKAGDPFWEEAHALFRPDLLAGMRVGAEREMRRMEAKLPPLLDTRMCQKAIALLDSRIGAVTVRIEDALEMRKVLGLFEKQFGVPERLKERAEAARREIAEAAALKDDPEILRNEPRLAATREEWRRYDGQYLAAMRRLGDADPEVERKANQEVSARMMAKNQEAFADIVRRFRER